MNQLKEEIDKLQGSALTEEQKKELVGKRVTYKALKRKEKKRKRGEADVGAGT